MRVTVLSPVLATQTATCRRRSPTARRRRRSGRRPRLGVARSTPVDAVVAPVRDPDELLAEGDRLRVVADLDAAALDRLVGALEALDPVPAGDRHVGDALARDDAVDVGADLEGPADELAGLAVDPADGAVVVVVDPDDALLVDRDAVGALADLDARDRLGLAGSALEEWRWPARWRWPSGRRATSPFAVPPSSPPPSTPAADSIMASERDREHRPPACRRAPRGGAAPTAAPPRARPPDGAALGGAGGGGDVERPGRRWRSDDRRRRRRGRARAGSGVPAERGQRRLGELARGRVALVGILGQRLARSPASNAAGTSGASTVTRGIASLRWAYIFATSESRS